MSKSDRARQIEVNTESSERNITENEETIVRVLENINRSRVLNFVFRQLLQEYITITYLHDVSFVYYNGFPESRRTCKLGGLDSMLREVLADEAAVAEVRNEIYTHLCNVADHTGALVPFIERVDEQVRNCIEPGEPKTFSYVRKRDELQQTYRNRTVKGIILDVADRIIRTPSLITDALLGQGEALDCYNQQLQDAAVIAAQMQNQRMSSDNGRLDSENARRDAEIERLNREENRKQQELDMGIDILNNIGDPLEQARQFKKVLTDCCDVPQSGCGCWERPAEEGR